MWHYSHHHSNCFNSSTLHLYGEQYGELKPLGNKMKVENDPVWLNICDLLHVCKKN